MLVPAHAPVLWHCKFFVVDGDGLSSFDRSCEPSKLHLDVILDDVFDLRPRYLLPIDVNRQQNGIAVSKCPIVKGYAGIYWIQASGHWLFGYAEWKRRRIRSAIGSERRTNS
jgi:hypothetical protein